MQPLEETAQVGFLYLAWASSGSSVMKAPNNTGSSGTL